MKLYEITEEIAALDALEDDGEVGFAEALQSSMDELHCEFADKATRVVAYRRNLEADVSAFDDEIKRLQAKKKAAQNRVDSITDYLRFNMQSAGMEKLNTGLFKISIVAGRDVAEISDESQLPDGFFKIERKPVKAEILKALKAGEFVPGATLGKSKPSLRIS